jgi:lipid-A-disaccharide synthase
VRYFFSTGEASGEANAVALAQAIRAYDDDAQFEGIGGERMRDAGFSVWREHAGWASMGPVLAVPRIPKLLRALWDVARRVALSRPDLLVLVDFGAFNLRLASMLRRRFAYRLPILDWFPPGAWFDNERQARAVARVAVPLTAFAHQHEFYKSLLLPVVYLGHPLASRYTPQPARPAPPPDAGVVALLPGSRGDELKRHAPVLRDAFLALRERRPRLRARIGASDARGEARLRRIFRDVPGATVVRGLREAVGSADAAWVASGTAVLETALLGVPTASLYILAPYLIAHARRVYRGRFITLPNLVLDREVIPEFIQEAATPQALADAMETLLQNPAAARAQLEKFRSALGPSDALEQSAKFAVALARAGRE